MGLSRMTIYNLINAGTLEVTARGKYNVILFDESVIEAERARRRDIYVEEIEALGYEVTLSPADVP